MTNPNILIKAAASPLRFKYCLRLEVLNGWSSVLVPKYFSLGFVGCGCCGHCAVTADFNVAALTEPLVYVSDRLAG